MRRTTCARARRRCCARSGSAATRTTTVLEENDVAVLLRSDHLEHIADASKAIFEKLDLFDVTSIRKGFAGGGFDGGAGLPKQMALAAGVPGAELIPDGAELFLGFTSTQAQGLGPRKIVNFETLGYVDLRSGYFHGGTHMHLSHIGEQLDTWYQLFDFDDRVDTVFRPGLRVREGTQTVRQGPEDVVDSRADRARLRGASDHRSQLGDPDGVAPAGRSRRRRRDASTARGRRFRIAPTSTRSTTRSSGAPIREVDGMSDAAVGGRALRRLQPDERRLRAHAERDGRRLPAEGVAAGLQRSRRATPGRASTRCSQTTAPAELPRAAAAAPRAFPLADAASAVGARRLGYVSRRRPARRRTTPAARSSARPSPPCSETSTIVSPWSAAIRPHEPLSTRSAALRP